MHAYTRAVLALVLAPLAPLAAQRDSAALVARHQVAANRIIAAALADSSAYRRLAELTDRFGHRFSGSESLERAIDWILDAMRRDGLQNVRGEPVTVPRWVRGAERAELVAPVSRPLPMLGLGGSIATPPGGITAEVLVVSSFEELERRAAEARGRIVLFDAPFVTYGQTVPYRRNGAVAAARHGAVASLIRSITPYSMKTPHTGNMAYDSVIPRIPHAAITVEDAMLLHRLQDRGQRPVVKLEMSAQMLPPAQSRNVVAELVGRDKPDEIIVLGGHIDSWDVGTGAMDDGGGSVVAWEAVRLLERLGLRPRRTLRVVLWTNEENGLAGANAYRDAHAAELDRHVLAIESDAGVFTPRGFGFTGSDAAYAIMRWAGSLLKPIGADSVARGGGGADIGPLMQRGVPGAGLVVDGTRYFWYHHTDADTIDKLDAAEMARCVATLAVMIYVIGELDYRLPRSAG
jgi:carboxypeptidase Q